MEELIQSSSFDLYCLCRNPVFFLCNDPICKLNPIMCSNTSCQCQAQRHLQCNIIKSKSMMEKILAKRKTLLHSAEVKKIITTVSRIYDEMIQKLSDQKEQMILKFQYFGLQQNSTKMFKYGVQGRFNDMSGELISKVSQQLKMETKTCSLEFDEFSIINQWEKQRAVFNQYLSQIKQFFEDEFLMRKNRSVVKMDSKILLQKKQVHALNQMLVKPVKGYNLLYRASQNQFSSSMFHTKCDNIPNTLVVINTQANKIIGGFTPLTWQGKCFKDDSEKSQISSFLFSLTLKQKYPCLKKQKAIYCSPAYGPLFGTNDIYLRDQCNVKKGCFNFPVHYSDGKVQNCQVTKSQFCGATKGDEIGVKQYQVFEVLFT